MRRWFKSQQGHSLAQSLLGLLLSMLVVLAAFTAFGWVQSSHRQMQAQIDVHQRLKTGLQLLRERVQRAGAPELFLAKGKVRVELLDNALEGTSQSLSLMHPRSLTPADCQGHQASVSWWLLDDFELNKKELSCKDSWRDDSTLQGLVEGVNEIEFLYAQAVPGSPAQLQWQHAEDVSNWNTIRGVQVCIQASQTYGTGLSDNSACASSSPTSSTRSWRGVAVFRHHSQ
jgi:type II secretory pathway component PulJ